MRTDTSRTRTIRTHTIRSRTISLQTVSRDRRGPLDREFDAVLVTAFISDAVALLDRSGLEHSLSNLDHTHCKVMANSLRVD